MLCTQRTGHFLYRNCPKEERGLSDFIADKQMKRGDIECYAYGKEGISTVRWMDNRSLHMITTADSCHLTTTMKRRQKGTSEKLSVVCPEIIKTYNYNMVGVDKSDQMFATRNWDRKALGKFYLRLHFDYLEQAIDNAKIAYETNVQPGFLAKNFRMALVTGLFGSANFRERKASLNSNTGTVDHLPIHLPNRKMCILCKKQKKDVKSSWDCSSQSCSQLCFCLLPGKTALPNTTASCNYFQILSHSYIFTYIFVYFILYSNHKVYFLIEYRINNRIILQYQKRVVLYL